MMRDKITIQMVEDEPKTSGASLEIYPSRELWLANRGILGGSGIAAVVGASTWDSRISLYCKLTGAIQDEDTPDKRRGRRLEPLVIEDYEQRFECELWHRKNSLFRATQNFHASVDALHLEKNIVLNAKAPRYKTKPEVDSKTGFRAGWGDDMTDLVPTGYIVSAQWEMAILGTEWRTHHIPALFGGSDFFVYVIRRDDEFIKFLFQKAQEFLEYVKTNTVPPVDDGLESTRGALLALHPRAAGEIIDADERTIKVIDERDRLMVEIKANERRKAELDALLMESIGNNLGVKTETITVLWEDREGQSRIDGEALKKKHPNIHKRFHKKGKPTRQLRRKEKNEKRKPDTGTRK